LKGRRLIYQKTAGKRERGTNKNEIKKKKRAMRAFAGLPTVRSARGKKGTTRVGCPGRGGGGQQTPLTRYGGKGPVDGGADKRFRRYREAPDRKT